MSKNTQPEGQNDVMLVNQEALSAALAASAHETPGEGFTFIETEPLLSAYCRAGLLQTLGKLALSGASPKVVRGVGADIHRLVVVAAQAMRSGYSSLLEDFLPEFAVPTSESIAQAAEDNEPSP